LGTGFLFHCVFGESSCSVYPCNPIVLPHFIIKPPTTAWTWGRPEDEAPPPRNPLYTIRGRGILNPLVSNALLGGCSIQTHSGRGYGCGRLGSRSLVWLQNWIPAASLFWSFWTYFIGWGFSNVLNGIFLFYLPEEKKKSPFGMVPFAIAWAVRWLASG